MKTIAVVFAAALALGAAMPAAQAAQNPAGTSLKVQSSGIAHAADQFSSRRGGWHGHGGGHRHGWHGGVRHWHGGWHGHRHWYGHRHYWRPHRHWGWRGYGWHRHRHCWRVWRHGRRVVVCGWRRW